MLDPPVHSTESLLLVPTRFERDRLRRILGSIARVDSAELCGFGPVTAAAFTAQRIARRGARRVLLLGLAGTYDPDRLAVGQAACFSTVALTDVGCGTAEQFRSAARMNFQLWDSETDTCDSIGETLPLSVPPRAPVAGHLLTCCAASGSAAHAAQRLGQHPRAVAEDLEGFGVAAACHLCGVPLTVVRGVSNRAGERQKERWKIDEALAAGWQLTNAILENEGTS